MMVGVVSTLSCGHSGFIDVLGWFLIADPLLFVDRAENVIDLMI